jgi:hypothetical protein
MQAGPLDARTLLDGPPVPTPAESARTLLEAPVSQAPKKALPPGILADATWPGMYRLVLLDGRLSDMLNLTRARDALRGEFGTFQSSIKPPYRTVSSMSPMFRLHRHGRRRMRRRLERLGIQLI